MIPLRNKNFYTKKVLKLLDEEVISILNRNVSTIENGINCLKQSVWDKMARLFSIFGHLQQWKMIQKHKYSVKVGWNIC